MQQLYTKEHVEKLIELAFLKGQEFATSKMLKRVTIAIGEQHDTQPEDFAYYTVAEREAADTFLSTFS